jgi:regulatory protein
MILSVKAGKADKIHIYIDGEYHMTCDRNFWYSEKWHNLKEIDSEELTRLEAAVSSRRAFLSGANLLSRRLHSKKELYLKLLQKYPKEAAQAACDKLEELLMLDDTDFAERYAKELSERKKYAPKRIEQELRLKGIDAETAKNAVSALDKDDFNRIILLLKTKYSSNLDTEKGIKRTVNALMRMGYSYADIKKALGEVTETESDDYE